MRTPFAMLSRPGFVRRLFFVTGSAAVVATLAVLVWWNSPEDANAVLRASASTVASVERTPAPDLGIRAERWQILDAEGDRVSALWRAAVAPEASLAANTDSRPWTVVLLGGLRTGDRAALLLPDTLRVNVLAVDWPWSGPRKMKPLEFARSVPAIRRALLRSPATLALGVEAAAFQIEVDPRRIALIGASLGVPTTIAAFELTRTPSACVLLHGAADIGEWLTHSLTSRSWPRVFASPVAQLAERLVQPLEPGLHANALSGVPVLIVNARADERVPVALATALHASLPWADVRWHEGRHVKPKISALLDELAFEVEDWLDSLGDRGGSPAGAETPAPRTTNQRPEPAR